MKRIYVFLMALILVFGISVSAHATLINMLDGTIYDTDRQLSWLQDANTNGMMNWYNAMTWADNLVFAGFDDWRLPTSIEQNGGVTYGITANSEMGHLYFTEMGNSSDFPYMTNTGDFTNLQTFYYWSSTEYDSFYAWVFSFGYGGTGNAGSQYARDKYWDSYAFAVRSGERFTSEPVPEPATLLLLGSGLAGMVVWRKMLGRRKG